ncbi:MAG: CdaR family protein [Candidatus Binatia bacterium]|nr:CdaR family protein [Candidatus Binatia bacterium]
MKPTGRAPRGILQTFLRPSWADLGTWLLAFLLASGLWFFVNAGARTSERTLRVRLDLIHVPAGMVITSTAPDYIEVRVSGSGLMLSSIDAQSLQTSLDLAGVQPGVATYTLNAKDFALPRSVEVNRVTPSRVSLSIDRLVRRKLPIRLDSRGEMEPGLKVVEEQLLPSEVGVTGPRGRVAAVTEVETQALDLATLQPGVNERTLDLLGPGGLVQLRQPTIAVQIVVERELSERTFDNVALEIQGSEGHWVAEPDRVRIVVRGPAVEIGSLELAPGAAYVDTAALAGRAAVEVRPLVTLPPGYEVLRLEPPTVTLQPEAQEADRELVGPLMPALPLPAPEENQ